MAECLDTICYVTRRRARPSSVIDIGRDAAQEDVVLAILRGSNARYVTWSHCCKLCSSSLLVGSTFAIFSETNPKSFCHIRATSAGLKPTILTTTCKTQAERYRNIPFSPLPNTFQDAVQITRGPGIRHLWNVSLCIIQDHTTDWEVESAKMAGIYLGSYLTLATTASAGSEGRFFPIDG